MERKVGTISRGIRCPIIRDGDDLVKITVDSVLEAGKTDGFEMRDRDVVALTESIVARAQGNYCTIQNVADDVKAKINNDIIASNSRTDAPESAAFNILVARSSLSADNIFTSLI